MMAEFSVNVRQLRQNGNRINEIANETLKNVIDTVCSVQEGIDNISYDLRVPLNDIYMKLVTVQKSVRQIAGIANLIASRYETAENNILGNPSIDAYGNMLDDTAGKSAESDDMSDLKITRSKDKSAWDKICTLADILGMSLWQTINLFLDLVQIFGAGLWEAETGWIDGYDWKEWLYEYVPNHVNDASLLAIFTLLTLDNMSGFTILAHYVLNLDGWNKYMADHSTEVYIEHQSAMKDLLYYGNYTAEYNACEVIAVYNALVAMNDGVSPVDFPTLLATFEGNGIMLEGDFGTDPTALYLYFDANGYDVDMLYGGSIHDSKLDKMQGEYDTYILTAYNDGDNLGEQIHTISITAEEVDNETKYVIHNAGDDTFNDDETYVYYDSLADAVNSYNDGNGEPISVIGIK